MPTQEVTYESLKRIICDKVSPDGADDPVVQILPILLLFSGLPASGKSKALELLLEKENEGTTFNQDITFSEFAYRQIIASGFKRSNKHYFEEVKTESSFLFCLQSGFKRNAMEMYVTGQATAFHYSFTEQKNIPSDIFKDACLSRELRTLYKYLQNLAPEPSNIEKFLPYGIGVINIWRLSVNRAIVQFLQAFSGVFYNSRMWLFADLEKDINSLHKLPKPDGLLTKWRTRLHYLLQSCKLSQINGEEQRKNICTIFACNSTPELLEKMKENCKSAAAQLGVSQLLNDTIVPLDFANKEEAWENLREQLRQLMKSKLKEVPLSWIFLRSSLQHHNKVYMTKDELKVKAAECNITDDDLKRFCDTFTSFGSILDISCIDENSKYIIVKPVEFLTILDMHLPGHTINERNGLVYTLDFKSLPSSIEDTVFMEILISAGLAVDIPCSHVSHALPAHSIDNGTTCYYMPSLRTTPPVQDWNRGVIQLVTSVTAPSVAMETALAREIRKQHLDVMLVLENKSNCTIVKVAATSIKITYYADVIEIFLEGGSREEKKKACNLVVTAAKNIADKRKQRPGLVQYHFAVTCTTDEHKNISLPFNTPRKRHILPVALCDKCKVEYSEFNDILCIWQEVLEEVYMHNK